MPLRCADNRNPKSRASNFRRQRVESFLRLIAQCKRPVRILDVGGTEQFWANTLPSDFSGLSITLLNTRREETSGTLPIASEAGDGRDLSRYATHEFDFCFSNSVIEHLGTLADQCRMAAEIRRVGKGYFVQTPYRYFPIEAHFHVPGWAQMPLSIRTALHRRFDLGGCRASVTISRRGSISR